MFDGLKNIGNMMELMKNARQMQEKMRELQEQLARKTVTGDAGGGMVQATINGRMELVKLTIDRTRFNPADIEMLEDVIVSAVRAGQEKAAEMMRQEMEKAAGDMGLPPGLLPK